MKRGDALHIMWTNGRSGNVHRGLCYELSDGKVLSLNDLRLIWEYLNDDIPLESTIKEARTGNRAKYVSEEALAYTE